MCILFLYPDHKLLDLEKTKISPRNPYSTLPTAYIYSSAAAKSLQSSLTLCDPTDGSPPGSPDPGTLQARILEGVAISFSNA